MNLDRQLARLMAAVIVMIIAYVSPSAVQAHEGHAHHGYHHAGTAAVAPAPPVVRTVTAAVVVTEVASASMPVVSRETVVGSAMVGSIRSDEADGGCCPGPCKGKCCGTMSCCVPGILGGSVSLPTIAYGHVVLAAHDGDGRSGVGPEALPRPPRTLA